MVFKYTYVEGKKEQVDALLTKIINYNQESGMLNDQIMRSFKFEHSEDGNGYSGIEVFADAGAATKYYENFMKAPFMEEMMGLSALTTQTSGLITGKKEEIEKCPYIYQFYPADG